MSCRHDLAGATCRRCYPAHGTIDPGPEGEYEDNLEGPGAVVSVMRYGGPFPAIKKTKERPPTSVYAPPPATEMIPVDPGRKQVEALAQAMRTEHYKQFLPFKAMTTWDTLGEERKAPWRRNATVAIEFLMTSR